MWGWLKFVYLTLPPDEEEEFIEAETALQRVQRVGQRVRPARQKRTRVASKILDIVASEWLNDAEQPIAATDNEAPFERSALPSRRKFARRGIASRRASSPRRRILDRAEDQWSSRPVPGERLVLGRAAASAGTKPSAHFLWSQSPMIYAHSPESAVEGAARSMGGEENGLDVGLGYSRRSQAQQLATTRKHLSVRDEQRVVRRDSRSRPTRMGGLSRASSSARPIERALSQYGRQEGSQALAVLQDMASSSRGRRKVQLNAILRNAVGMDAARQENWIRRGLKRVGGAEAKIGLSQFSDTRAERGSAVGRAAARNEPAHMRTTGLRPVMFSSPSLVALVHEESAAVPIVEHRAGGFVAPPFSAGLLQSGAYASVPQSSAMRMARRQADTGRAGPALEAAEAAVSASKDSRQRMAPTEWIAKLAVGSAFNANEPATRFGRDSVRSPRELFRTKPAARQPNDLLSHVINRAEAPLSFGVSSVRLPRLQRVFSGRTLGRGQAQTLGRGHRGVSPLSRMGRRAQLEAYRASKLSIFSPPTHYVESNLAGGDESSVARETVAGRFANEVRMPRAAKRFDSRVVDANTRKVTAESGTRAAFGRVESATEDTSRQLRASRSERRTDILRTESASFRALRRASAGDSQVKSLGRRPLFDNPMSFLELGIEDGVAQRTQGDGSQVVRSSYPVRPTVRRVSEIVRYGERQGLRLEQFPTTSLTRSTPELVSTYRLGRDRVANSSQETSSPTRRALGRLGSGFSVESVASQPKRGGARRTRLFEPPFAYVDAQATHREDAQATHREDAVGPVAASRQRALTKTAPAARAAYRGRNVSLEHQADRGRLALNPMAHVSERAMVDSEEGSAFLGRLMELVQARWKDTGLELRAANLSGPTLRASARGETLGKVGTGAQLWRLDVPMQHIFNGVEEVGIEESSLSRPLDRAAMRQESVPALDSRGALLSGSKAMGHVQGAERVERLVRSARGLAAEKRIGESVSEMAAIRESANDGATSRLLRRSKSGRVLSDGFKGGLTHVPTSYLVSDPLEELSQPTRTAQRTIGMVTAPSVPGRLGEPLSQMRSASPSARAVSRMSVSSFGIDGRGRGRLLQSPMNHIQTEQRGRARRRVAGNPVQGLFDRGQKGSLGIAPKVGSRRSRNLVDSAFTFAENAALNTAAGEGSGNAAERVLRRSFGLQRVTQQERVSRSARNVASMQTLAGTPPEVSAQEAASESFPTAGVLRRTQRSASTRAGAMAYASARSVHLQSTEGTSRKQAFQSAKRDSRPTTKLAKRMLTRRGILTSPMAHVAVSSDMSWLENTRQDVIAEPEGRGPGTLGRMGRFQDPAEQAGEDGMSHRGHSHLSWTKTLGRHGEPRVSKSSYIGTLRLAYGSGDERLGEGHVPGWVERAVHGDLSAARQVRRQKELQIGAVRRLVRSQSVEQMFEVLDKHREVLQTVGRTLPRQASQLMDQLVSLDTTRPMRTASEMELPSLVETPTQSRGSGRRVVKQTNLSSNRRGRASSSATRAAGSGRTSFLASQLLGLIHLAEVEQRKSDAQQDVRMSQAEPSSAGGGGESTGTDEKMEVPRMADFFEEILDYVMRNLELDKLRNMGN